jgi:AbrB family looped-hinge helix DNA binding protein
MPRARLTSKGQVTIPIAVRQRLGLRTGDEIDFDEDRGVFILRKHVRESAFQRYRGFLTHLRGRKPDTLLQDMRGS